VKAAERLGLHSGDGARGGLGVRTRGQDGDRDRGQRRHARTLLLRHHARDVPLRDVRDFVAQHPYELRFRLRRQEQARVHSDETTWQGERVDRAVLQREEREIHARIRTDRYQPIADPVEVVRDVRIIEIGRRRTYLTHDPVADRTLLAERKRRLGRIAQFGKIVCPRRNQEAEREQD